MQYYACVATGCMLACERELGSPIASVCERVRSQLLLKLSGTLSVCESSGSGGSDPHAVHCSGYLWLIELKLS